MTLLSKAELLERAAGIASDRNLSAYDALKRAGNRAGLRLLDGNLFSRYELTELRTRGAVMPLCLVDGNAGGKEAALLLSSWAAAVRSGCPTFLSSKGEF